MLKQVCNRKVFALVVRRFEDIFHSFYVTEVIRGASYSASRLKVDLLIHITEKTVHADWLTAPSLNLDCIDGILFADIDSDVKTLKKVVEKKIPCLVMNNYLKEPINCIAIDNKGAAVEVVNYLAGLGHKKIATITGDLSTQAGIDRLEGYKVALTQHKIAVNANYIRTGNFLRTPAHQAAQTLLTLRERPSAIFAASDIMALEVISVAKEKKIKVPQDLSVVGFDDNPLAEYSSVGLTTVRQPITEMGRLAVENLYNIVTGKTRDLPVKILLPTELIQRKSCERRD
ncbi:MAG: substrate-binding domain-containing protein [Candidatus Omnitrophota bacterium]|nr:substrate-binding domain-containing protein [Candidatus Omnitrophota bacterium]